MPLLVMKFGGTSVGDLDRIANAAAKVKREVERGYDVIVIVSAMSGKTNELVGWVEKTSPLYDAREYDAVVSSGENRGRRLRHTNVVVGVETLGDWNGRPVLYALPDQMAAGEAVAVMIQAKGSRQILAGAVLAPR